MGKVKTPAKSKGKVSVSSAVNVGKQLLGVKSIGQTSEYKRKHRRHGVAWYAREIARIKLKKRYEKIKYRV